MIKFIFKLFVVLGLVNFLSFAGDVAANNITKYEVTINKLEIFNSTTNNWVVISDTPATIDIASGSKGADIGSMLSPDTKIPYGTYTKNRITISDTFTINACDGGGNCTNGNTLDDGRTPGTTEGAVGAVLANGVDTTVEMDFVTITRAIADPDVTGTATGSVIVKNFTSPLIINEYTESMNVSVKFNLNFALGSNMGTLFTVDSPSIIINIK